MASARRLLISLIALLQNRIEIFGIELQEEKCRLLELFLWGMMAVFLAVLAVVTFSLGLLSLVWNHPALRFGCILVLGVLYVVGAWIAWLRVAKKLQSQHKPFEETLKALAKDLSCLNPQD